MKRMIKLKDTVMVGISVSGLMCLFALGAVVNFGQKGHLSGLVHAAGVPKVADGQGKGQDDPFDRAKSKFCSLGTVKGTYAFGLTGSVIGVGPIGASGTTTFDGEGNFSITGYVNTTTLNPVQHGTFNGTYTVNPVDCTASATVNVPAPGLFGLTQVEFQAVIVDEGREIRYLITTPGVAFAGATVRR